MDSLLAVTGDGALRFFFERLGDVIENDRTPEDERLYNASVLAHFATTSTTTSNFPQQCPSSLLDVLDLYVLDRSQYSDPTLMETAGSQCLLLTGFFGDQQKRRHNVNWYAKLGAGFYESAGRHHRHRERAKVMLSMAEHFDYWRRTQGRLAVELREKRYRF